MSYHFPQSEGEAFSGIDERWVDELFAESGLVV